MNISATQIELLKAERGWTNVTLAERCGRASAPSSGAGPVAQLLPGSWHGDWEYP